MQLLWITMVRLRTYYRLWNQNAILCFSLFIGNYLNAILGILFHSGECKEIGSCCFYFLKELLPGYFM